MWNRKDREPEALMRRRWKAERKGEQSDGRWIERKPKRPGISVPSLRNLSGRLASLRS
jgi:hypothetical protein